MGHEGEGRGSVVDKGDGGGRGQGQPIECLPPKRKSWQYQQYPLRIRRKQGRQMTWGGRELVVDRIHSAGALWDAAAYSGRHRVWLLSSQPASGGKACRINPSHCSNNQQQEHWEQDAEENKAINSSDYVRREEFWNLAETHWTAQAPRLETNTKRYPNKTQNTKIQNSFANSKYGFKYFRNSGIWQRHSGLHPLLVWRKTSSSFTGKFASKGRVQNEKGNMLHVTFGKALKGLKEKGPHLISFPNMIWGGRGSAEKFQWWLAISKTS